MHSTIRSRLRTLLDAPIVDAVILGTMWWLTLLVSFSFYLTAYQREHWITAVCMLGMIVFSTQTTVRIFMNATEAFER